MRIITLNLNGIRAAGRKGFFAWLSRQRADVVCLQETKAQIEQLVDPMYYPNGYHHYFNDAVKKGYSGVAIYTKHKPDKVISQLGWSFADDEGRYLQIDLGRLSIISMYLPSGSSGEERQAVKFDFLERYEKIIKKQLSQDREYIICGDLNIAHKIIDIKNWKANQKNSGFLPEERAWMDKLIDELGYVDAFRVLNQEAEQYTWWSNRGQAYDKNVGWRLDYQMVSPQLADSVKKVKIYKEQRFSDHAPVIIDYDI